MIKNDIGYVRKNLKINTVNMGYLKSGCSKTRKDKIMNKDGLNKYRLIKKTRDERDTMK